MTEKREYTIDAAGKRLGRVASEAAHVLLGKDTTAFTKNTIAAVTVTVANANDLDISEKKARTKVYDRYSGFHGGRKEETLEEVIEKKGIAEAVKRAVYNMLPGNRLRKERMKNLIIK